MSPSADDVTIDNGTGTDYDVATDDDGAGNHVQIVKLAQSADQSRTPISADSDGMLVNLGANNDVTVTGTVTANLAAGTNNIGDVDVLSLPASTNTIEIVGDAAHDAAVAGNPVLIGAEFDDTTPDSVDEGDVGRLRISANRNLYSTIRDAAGNERGANVNSSNQLSVSVDNTVTVGSHAVTNAGTFAVQESGSALTALQLIDDTVFADDAAFTVGTSKVNAMGAMADESSTDSVDEGDVGIPRMTLDRKLRVTQTPHTAGGLDVFRTLDADETEEDVKTSAGQVYGWYIYNDASSEVYVKLYNATAANTTVGSTTPRMTIPIPASSAANVEFTNGIIFDTAICIAATTGVGDADTTAPAANQVVANILYK